MNIKFRVHGVSRTSVPMKVEAAGEALVANVPALEVELVTESDVSGSLTLRFFGKDMAEAEAIFKPDAELCADFVSSAATYTPDAPAPKKKAA